MFALPATSPARRRSQFLETHPERASSRRLMAGWMVLLIASMAVDGCCSTRVEKAMDVHRYHIAGPYPAGINPEQSSPGILVTYAFAFRQCQHDGAIAYGTVWKRFDFFVAPSDIMEPSLDAQELCTLRWIPDLESLAERVKTETDDGYSVYTLPPERLFAPDTPHPPVRALTRDEVETVRRLIGK